MTLQEERLFPDHSRPLDQSYIIAALKELGPSYVGVTQLPATVSDDEVLSLNDVGVRGVRFNLKTWRL